MRKRSRIQAAFAAVLFAAAAGSAAFAQHVRPAGEPPPRPIVPNPIRTMAPLATPSPQSAGVPDATPTPRDCSGSTFPETRLPSLAGQRVPVASLAPLPPKTSRNTASFGASGGRHIMSATGADVNYFADTAFNSSRSSHCRHVDSTWLRYVLAFGRTYRRRPLAGLLYRCERRYRNRRRRDVHGNARRAARYAQSKRGRYVRRRNVRRDGR